jgi:predicted Rossmann-fold nucleotide-binding protein
VQFTTFGFRLTFDAQWRRQALELQLLLAGRCMRESNSRDQHLTAERLYSFRRVGVCGGSKGLPSSAAGLCRAIGRRLARETTVAIVSGGTKRRKRAIGRDDFAAEWFVVSAAEREIASEHIDERIFTVVTDDDGAASSRFRIGSPLRARGKTSEARRISFVRGLDALIAIGGGDGTRQELALAVEFGLKVLPVPGFDGAAAEVWQAYRSEVIGGLHIDERRARRWEESISSNKLDPKVLADDMIEALMSSLPKRCFVIMPFHQNFNRLYDSIIDPVITLQGDAPVRVDRVGSPGNVTAQIEDGLRTCDYAIAVLDHLRPNVLYELGGAHAHRKPVILLNQRGALGTEGVPFDIQVQQRLEYTNLDGDLADLQARLSQMVRMARGVSR